MRLSLPALVCAAFVATGCASGPMLAGSPGQMRQVVPLGALGAGPQDPSLCAATISENFYVFLTAVVNRPLRLLTQEHPNVAGCDLVLRFVHPGSSIFSRDEIFAYSAYGGALLWQGASTGAAGKYGAQFLLEQLARDFMPGLPWRVELDADKTSGRRVTKADLDRGGLFLLSEAGMNARLRRVIAESAGGSTAPLTLAATAPAAPSLSAAAPVAAPVRSDVDTPPSAAPVSSKRHAVVIGIERYREKLPAADFAAGDAKLAAEYYKRVLGVPEANVALLVDERATKSDFEKHFERWLPNRVAAGDEVFVYFSGHGAPNPAKGDAYLVPYDGDPTYIEQTGYPLAKLYAHLAKLPAKRVLVAMDSCFSGAGGRSVIAKGARPLVSVVSADVPANVTVLSASAGDQISNSYQEKGRGLFTYFLLKGMKEKGADFKAVFDYLKPEVARIARREYNADQDPQWREGK